MNIKRVRGQVDRIARENKNKNNTGVFWLTGLSGSGKSTIAHTVEKQLFDMGIQAVVFDGDNIRHGLCKDLGFSQQDRSENLRRISEVSKLFVENGTICLCAFITPLDSDRELIKKILGDDYYEIYVACPLEVCESRDVKGYYRRARAGDIKNYTGISAPYDIPQTPDLTLNTNKEAVAESIEKVMAFVLSTINQSKKSNAKLADSICLN